MTLVIRDITVESILDVWLRVFFILRPNALINLANLASAEQPSNISIWSPSHRACLFPTWGVLPQLPN